jgi:hypothetical protein
MKMQLHQTRQCAKVVFIAKSNVAQTGREETVVDDFLEQLVGSWNLTGSMGPIKLHQRVTAEWTIGGNFLRVHIIEDGPPSGDRSPYEAIYMIGRDSRSGEYVMHLFDTFGAGYSRTIGIGSRAGDAVEILFDYPDGPFSNRFSWDKEHGRWEMLLRQKDMGGGWKTFATKTLSRS